MTLPAPPSGLDAVIVPRARDLGGGFTVRRALPAQERQMVGPFIFFDQIGPLVMAPGQALDVRPHPHIGLATVTYLLEGEILHRDSLGSAQPIQPGAVNWMTAGRGIVHSERTPEPNRAGAEPMYGVQTWVALPKAHEETAPGFVHHPAATLPTEQADGVTLRVVAGRVHGVASVVPTLSALFYADLALAPGASFALEAEYDERAIYVLDGAVELGGQLHEPGRLLVAAGGGVVELRAPADRPARLLLLGGEPMDGPRHLWWNFVSSSKDRIEAAKEDWRAGRFGKVPGDETEFIPLPA